MAFHHVYKQKLVLNATRILQCAVLGHRARVEAGKIRQEKAMGRSGSIVKADRGGHKDSTIRSETSAEPQQKHYAALWQYHDEPHYEFNHTKIPALEARAMLSVQDDLRIKWRKCCSCSHQCGFGRCWV